MCPRFASRPARPGRLSPADCLGLLVLLGWLASPAHGQAPGPLPVSAAPAVVVTQAAPGPVPDAHPGATAGTPAAATPGPTPGPIPGAPAANADRGPSPAGPAGSDRPLPAQLPLRQLTEQGIQQFQQGEYDAAIESFSAAHVLSPNPMFLFNIAQAHRKAGRPREALLHYQLFLRKAPDSPLRPETEAYIALVETQLQSRQQAAQRVQSPAEHAPPPLPIGPPHESPARPLYKKGWFYGVLFGSAAVVGLGVGLGVYFATRPPATSLGIVDPVF